MPLVPRATVESFCEVSSGNFFVGIFHPAAEAQLQNILVKRNLASTLYRHEKYDGKGSNALLLNNYPIIEVQKVSSYTASCFTIQNDSTDSPNVGVIIDSDAGVLKLQVVGGTNAHSWTSFLYSSYATIGALITAINAYGKGWVATVDDATYEDYPSTTLLNQTIQDCFEGDSVLMPGDSIIVNCEEESGIIRAADGSVFPSGIKNIIVTYRAGYATIPDDIVYVVCSLVKNLYLRNKNNVFDGMRKQTLGDISMEFYQTIERHPDLLSIINKYKKRIV